MGGTCRLLCSKRLRCSASVCGRRRMDSCFSALCCPWHLQPSCLTHRQPGCAVRMDPGNADGQCAPDALHASLCWAASDRLRGSQLEGITLPTPWRMQANSGLAACHAGTTRGAYLLQVHCSAGPSCSGRTKRCRQPSREAAPQGLTCGLLSAPSSPSRPPSGMQPSPTGTCPQQRLSLPGPTGLSAHAGRLPA